MVFKRKSRFFFSKWKYSLEQHNRIFLNLRRKTLNFFFYSGERNFLKRKSLKLDLIQVDLEYDFFRCTFNKLFFDYEFDYKLKMFLQCH